LFEPEADQLNVDAIAQQLQQLFYELAFFPTCKAASKTDPGKAPALFQVWEGLKGLIRCWANYWCEIGAIAVHPMSLAKL
jgi:S-DNA-T family DNA segregation ATPase FtsK/SpoIIIE